MSWIKSALSPCDLPGNPCSETLELILYSSCLEILNFLFLSVLCKWSLMGQGRLYALTPTSCFHGHPTFLLLLSGFLSGFSIICPHPETTDTLHPWRGNSVSRHVTPHSVKGFLHLPLKSSHALANENHHNNWRDKLWKKGKIFLSDFWMKDLAFSFSTGPLRLVHCWLRPQIYHFTSSVYLGKSLHWSMLFLHL